MSSWRRDGRPDRNTPTLIEGRATMPSSGHGPESDVGKVAVYLRVSSDEQRDRETIEIQREFLEQYRSLYELEVAEIYEDDGVSGTTPLHERPEGKRLLQDAKEER